ncbi:MAG: SAM-dependent methyltransferase [Bacteroidetes bacterium]|nr:MAG: SAM-dependent methyltransferase [Bacteroidota bacterium]
MRGKLYLIPNTLGGETLSNILPQEVIETSTKIRFFAVEELRSARRLLRKMDREFPIDSSTFIELNKRTEKPSLYFLIQQLKKGFDVGIISEAGCPGIADPGAVLVAMAHEEGIEVSPLVGPSSILLALIGSGFSGQKFTFHGYLPKERKDRIKSLKDFEADSRRNGHTHIFMDTPFRNMNVLDDLLNELSDPTELCIASNLTLLDQRIRTMSVKNWRENAYDLAKIPAMFLIGKSE